MREGPGLFSDIGKKAKDLLTKDYSSDQKFTVSTHSDAGVVLTSTAVKKGGLSTGDVAALYKYKNIVFTLTAMKKGGLSTGGVAALYKYKNIVFYVKVDTVSNISTTLTFTDILPCTKTIASFKVTDFDSGKLKVKYFHEHATFTSSVALNQAPSIYFSATIGTPSITLGAEVGYDINSAILTKYTAGISVAKPDSCTSIILGDKGDTIKASYVHRWDLLKKSAAVGEITRRFSTNENTFTVGGSYALDPLTTVKAKLNNHGKLGALLRHEVGPKSLVTISGEIDPKALKRNPKFGLAIALKP